MELFGFELSLKDIFLLVIAAIIGGFISYFITKNVKNKKSISFKMIQRYIVFELGGLDFPFEVIDKSTSKKLDALYCLTVRLWNNGTEPIKKEDFSTKDPLRIKLEDDVEVIGNPIVRYANNSSIEFSLKESSQKNEFLIDFDYLNPKEWIICEFYVVNNPNSAVSLNGRVCGLDTNSNSNLDDSKIGLLERIGAICMLLFIIACPISICMLLYFNFQEPNLNVWSFMDENNPEYISRYQGFAATPLLFIILFYIRKCIKKIGNPKDFPEDNEYTESQFRNFLVISKMALTGKNYRISNSINNFGEITITNSKDKLS